MSSEPEERGGLGIWKPLDHSVETRRDAEIRQQATEDAEKSFDTVRDQLREAVAPYSPSKDAKRG